jgi:hypothetical protein
MNVVAAKRARKKKYRSDEQTHGDENEKTNER